MTGPHTGGCQCGAVRFRAAKVGHASICHCRMCQKAFGGFFAALASVDHADLEWTRGQLAIFASSDVVDRGFCDRCGTPLTFFYRGGDETDMAVGAFDDPSRIVLSEQIWASARVPTFDTLHALPPRPEDEPGFDETVANVAATNHQHPDHDTDAWPPESEMP